MELGIAVVRYTIPESPAGGGAECARAVGWSSRFGAGAREIMENYLLGSLKKGKNQEKELQWRR